MQTVSRQLVRALGRACSLIGVVLIGGAAVLATPSAAAAQDRDTIVRWNRAMLTAVAAPGALPPTGFITRPLAITSVAVFDAVNSFDRTYHPYATVVTPIPGASRDAAAAQAAHDVLVALVPSQRAALDALLADTLTRLPEQAARDGATMGAAIAQATLALRQHDGWERPVKPLVLPALPGY